MVQPIPLPSTTNAITYGYGESCRNTEDLLSNMGEGAICTKIANKCTESKMLNKNFANVSAPLWFIWSNVPALYNCMIQAVRVKIGFKKKLCRRVLAGSSSNAENKFVMANQYRNKEIRFGRVQRIKSAQTRECVEGSLKKRTLQSVCLAWESNRKNFCTKSTILALLKLEVQS